jgi:hypothetical protein
LKITALNGDQRACLAYEQSLFFLERFDDVAARAAIEGWPTTTTDPMWAIRRAGMLAELGEHKSAKQIANSTLDQVRRGQRAGVDSIPVYSREGWASRSATELHFVPLSYKQTGLEEAERDRQRELEQWERDRQHSNNGNVTDGENSNNGNVIRDLGFESSRKYRITQYPDYRNLLLSCMVFNLE